MLRIINAALLFLLLWPAAALAQTGPVAEAKTDFATLNILAVILVIVICAGLLALFEPWTWGQKLSDRQRRKKRDRR